jgi:hypothetical protein
VIDAPCQHHLAKAMSHTQIALQATRILALLGSLGCGSTFAQVAGQFNLSNPPGYSMPARRLLGLSTTVGDLFGAFPAVPDGLTVFTMDSSGFKANNYLNGRSDPNLPLNPGDGWFIRNPYGTNVLLTVAGQAVDGVNQLPAGFSACNSFLPMPGGLASALGLPAANDDVGDVFHNAANAYSIYTVSATWSLQARPPRPALFPYRSEGSHRAILFTGVSTCGSPSTAASCSWWRLGRAPARRTLPCPSLHSVRSGA